MIETKDVSHTYQRGRIIVEALKQITITVEKTEFLAIIGETGSGKTTFTQHLNGLLKPTSGVINVLDYTITNKKKEQKKIPYKLLRRDIGMVFQFPEQQLFAPTVLEDVMFAPLNFGSTKEEAKKQAMDILKTLQLDESLYEKAPFMLSGGQKRKVALAGVLVTKPQIVVLDEPFAGLDPRSRDELLVILKSYQQRTGAMMIIISHDMDLVWNLCQQTIVFQEGNVVYSGSTEVLFSNPTYVEQFHLEKPTILAAEQYVAALRGEQNE